MRNLASDPDLLPLLFLFFAGVLVGGAWDVAKEAKEKKPRASFIIRVVNFMTGWIPDSPPTPFLSLFLLLPPRLRLIFFFITSRIVGVRFFSISLFDGCLATLD